MPQRISPSLLWRHGRLVASRLGWGVGDQAMGSLTNFLLNVYVARSLGAAEFGAFSLAYVTYGFALNVSRGLSFEPLLIRFSNTDMKVWRRAVSGCAGTALVVGLATGTCALAAAVLIGGTTGQAFLALGLMLPALLLQDSWRYAFFSVQKGYHAFVNDTVWAVVQFPLLVFLKSTGHGDVFWFVIAWGAGAAAGSVLASFQARVVPSLVSARTWLIAHRDLGPRYVLENAGGNAGSTVQSYGVSSLLGVTAVGDISAANVLMGPFRIVYLGASMITIPEAVKLLRHSPRQLPRFCVAVSMGLAALALAWAVVLVVVLPLGLGQVMMGNIWRSAYPLVIPTALATLFACAGIGAGIGLHAMGAARRSVRSTLMGGAISLTLALIGAAVWGMYGTVLLAAVGMLITAAISWRFFVKAMQESGQVPVPRWLAWVAVGPGARQAADRSRQPAVTAPQTPIASPEG
jgi:O-antigen/teichoic acid export membrane protein